MTVANRSGDSRSPAHGPATDRLRAQAERDTCSVCGAFGEFVQAHRSIREGFQCPNCRASLRYRHQAAAILDELSVRGSASFASLVEEPEFAALDIYEPGIIGPFRKYLKALPGYVNSYFWEEVPPGQSHKGVRCEDLQALTFPDRSFDLAISSDIFEHVREPFRAFAELKRVLRPGGRHIFTVPLGWPLPERTVSRVELDDSGDDRFVLPPVYHGSPTDSKGSLVYTDFGLDLSDRLREIGFETRVYYGPQYNLTFAAQAPDEPAPASAARRGGGRRRETGPSAQRSPRLARGRGPTPAPTKPLGAGRLRSVSQLASWLVPPTPGGLRLLVTYLRLRSSGQFDPDFYRAQYPDVARAGLDPLMHYVEHGWRGGRDPSPEFSTSAYLERRPEVARSGMNPLLHHLRHAREGEREA